MLLPQKGVPQYCIDFKERLYFWVGFYLHLYFCVNPLHLTVDLWAPFDLQV